MTCHPVRASRLASTSLLAAVCLWTVFGTQRTLAQTGVSYSGRATVVNVTDIHQPVPGPIIIADTGPLPSTGGFLEASVLETNIANGELTLELAHATTSGDGPEARSETSVNNFVVMIMATDGTESSLRADFIGAQATASCKPNGNAVVSGGVTIEGLVLNGQAIVVTKKANQVILFPGGKIIINEQTSSVSGNTGSITVTPIHILVDGCMNGAIGTVHADITCGTLPPPPSDCGKLTGGGWIVTPSGFKGPFGVSGGIRRGQFWGHLNYIDHSNGMHVKSTAVTGFKVDPSDSTCRIITYNVLIDGAAGTATVHACDKGEPGRDDIFDITLSNGYHAGGDLGGNDPGGGNIQLHKCPPGWM
jgi:hypothetical protein